MGQFKPMVKMMTTEPSVVLKLKKGGHVSMKHGGKSDGHKMMNGGVMAGLAEGPTPSRMQMGQGTLPGRSPARPSLAMRRKMARPMMKEGGESKAEHAAEMKKMMGTEAKLKKHASMPASKAHKGLATGGVVMGQSGFKKGGAVPKSGILPIAESERGAKSYVKTKMDTAQGEHHTPKKTGDVSMGKPGGYKRGGKAYAKGGGVEGNVSTSKPGVSNTKTGSVRLGNAGGYKHGGRAAKDSPDDPTGDLGYFNNPQAEDKRGNIDLRGGNAISPNTKPRVGGGEKKGGAIKKHYATGGLVDSGKPVAYPKKPASAAISNDRQSGTFKRGGKVKFNDGGAAGPVSNYERDMMKKNVKPVKDPEAVAAKASRDLDEALNPVGIFKELGSKLRDKLRGQGAVTETEKSVTVSPPPAKKRAGGAC